MPVQYAGIREEHVAVREGVGVFDVSHMGEVETTGPDAERFLQRVLSNDVSKIAVDGAQYSVLCRENGGVLDDLFTYRHGSGFLTVTNAVQPRARPRSGCAARRAATTSRSTTACTTTRCSPSRARRARAGRPPGRRRAAAALPHRPHAAGRRARRARVRHRLHRRGRGRAADRARVRDHDLGRPRRGRRHPRRPGRARHAAARGLLPPLRQRPDGGARADRGGPRLVLQGGHRLHRLRGRPRRPRRPARRRSWCRSP